jgi:hypothetical protein
VLDQRRCDEGCAVSTDADEDAGKARLGCFGEIDDLGDVREVVATKGDDVRLPAPDRAEIGALVLNLQVEQPNRVSGLTRRGGDKFEADRLELEENLRVGQRAGSRPAAVTAYCEAELPAFRRVPRIR